MHYQILGWYGRGNCGDDAFVSAFEALLPSNELSFRRPSAGLVSVTSAERLVLGGGDVVKSYYLDCIRTETPFVIVGCGLGYEDELNLLKGRNVQAAILRNRRDAELASGAGLNARYAPDLCFALDPAQIEVRHLKRKQPTKKRLGVILSAHAMPGQEQKDYGEAAYYEYLQWELASALSTLSEWYEIYWISFSADFDAWDEVAHYGVRRRMLRRDDQTFIPYQPNTHMLQIGFVAQMDLLITMKFHGAIFATICAVPFVAIGQTRKLVQYGAEEGLNDLVIPRFAFEKSRFLQTVKSAEDAQIAPRLKGIAERNRAAVKAAIEELSTEIGT